jgi:DNA-binding transcriptional regulator YbjK
MLRACLQGGTATLDDIPSTGYIMGYKETEMGKTSIYLDDYTLKLIEERTTSEGASSDTIRSMLSRYADICRQARLNLDVGEWRLIAESLNETWMRSVHERSSVKSLLWIQVQDCIQLTKADSKHQVDGKELVNKLTEMSIADSVAVLDEIERHWAITSKHGARAHKFPGE